MKVVASNFELLHGVPIDQIPIRGADTGIPIRRLIGFVLRNSPIDPIGGWVDNELVVYNDWRLRALQEREGAPVTPEPATLIVVRVLH